MGKNVFAATEVVESEQKIKAPVVKKLEIPDYTESCSTLADHIAAFLIGFIAGFLVLHVFYQIWVLSLLGGVAVGIVNIYTAQRNKTAARIKKLRLQFFDMLEAMSVSMRAGNPVLKALQSARGDLELIYSENSDIIVELDIILSRFQNAMPLSQAFEDFARRSGLEDVSSFASIYATIEGKSSRADEIVRETQQIIADKMEIEMEIDTLMTAAKSEVNIMLMMPLVILGVIAYAGAGFMDSIYTTNAGRFVATGGLIVFIISYVMAKKFSNVQI